MSSQNITIPLQLDVTVLSRARNEMQNYVGHLIKLFKRSQKKMTTINLKANKRGVFGPAVKMVF